MEQNVRLRLHVSTAMDTLLQENGLDKRAMARAYMLLGTAATGIPMLPFRTEIARLFALNVSTEVARALEDLWRSLPIHNDVIKEGSPDV